MRWFLAVLCLAASAEAVTLTATCPRVLPQTHAVTDPKNPLFHVSGTLYPNGTLVLGSLRHLSDGSHTDIVFEDAVREILKHFGTRVHAVELSLSQFTFVDDIGHLTTLDPYLDLFNAEYRKESNVRKSLLATPLGWVLNIPPNSFLRASLTASLGNPGRFISVSLRLERAAR